MQKVSLEEACASREENLRWTQSETDLAPVGQSPLAAIRRKCLDCSCFSHAEIAECPITRCAIWPYRFGRSPFRGQNGTEIQGSFDGEVAEGGGVAPDQPAAGGSAIRPIVRGVAPGPVDQRSGAGEPLSEGSALQRSCDPEFAP